MGPPNLPRYIRILIIKKPKIAYNFLNNGVRAVLAPFSFFMQKTFIMIRIVDEFLFVIH